MGDELEAEFKTAPKQKGTFSFEEGSYSGEWIAKAMNLGEEDQYTINIREGIGTFTFPDGCVYEGEWSNDEMNGNGTMTFADGKVYQGGFKDNMFEGKGQYNWPDESYYNGSWKSNKFHGEGTYVTAKGRKFDGMFVFGSYNSASSYISTNPPTLEVGENDYLEKKPDVILEPEPLKT